MARYRRRQQIKWHRFLAKGFELSVGQRGVLVFAEIEVTQNPPKVDVLLLRRDTDNWTPEQLALLPDGIRDCNAKHILIEFKYTESLTVEAIRQAVGYEYFYRIANELDADEVRMFCFVPRRRVQSICPSLAIHFFPWLVSTRITMRRSNIFRYWY